MYSDTCTYYCVHILNVLTNGKQTTGAKVVILAHASMQTGTSRRSILTSAYHSLDMGYIVCAIFLVYFDISLTQWPGSSTLDAHQTLSSIFIIFIGGFLIWKWYHTMMLDMKSMNWYISNCMPHFLKILQNISYKWRHGKKKCRIMPNKHPKPLK